MLIDIPRNKDMWREKHTERRREIYRDKYRETNNAETQIRDTQIHTHRRNNTHREIEA